MRRSERSKNAPAVNAGWWRRPVALGMASSVAVTTFGLPALADVDTQPDEQTESAASIIDLSLLGTELAGGGSTRALFPSGPETDEGGLDASLLGSEVLDLGGLQLPIDQIIDYGELGALLSKSTATDGKNGEAITGIAGGDGAVTLDGADSDFGTAKLDLLSLFRATGVDGLTDEIVSKAELTAGVGGAHVQAVDGEFQDPDGVGGDGQYRVAEANLEVVSPVVEQISAQLYDAIGQIDQLTEDTVGGMNELTGLITSITDSLGAVADVTLDYSIESNMQEEIFQEILAQPITSKNEILTIDFSTGSIYVDLDKVYSGERPEGPDLPDGINNQNPNTELISTEIYPIIGESVHDLINEVVNVAVSAVEGALGSVTLDLTAGASALGQGATASWSVNLMGDEVEPVSCEPDGIAGGPLCTTLETAINTVVGPIIETGLIPIRDFILSDGGQEIYELAVTDIKTSAMTVPIRTVLEPVFTLLSQVVSLQLNRQVVETCEGPDGEVTESLEVSALSLGLIQSVDAGRLNLGTAGVRTGACESAAIDPALAVDPGSVEPGQDTSVSGTGFTPEGEVSVQLTDPEGAPVGEPIVVSADAEGALPATPIPVPADAQPGEYTIIATDTTTDTPAEGTLTVTEPGTAPEPGQGSIGDTVFADGNANGIQDQGEAGVPNVTVNLLDAEGNPVTDQDGTPRTTTSDDQGNYSFGDLPTGGYIVEFVAPEGKTFAPAQQGDDRAADSDPAENGRTAPVELTAEAPSTDTVDAGLVDDDGQAPTPSVSVDPTEVPAGEDTTVTGEGYAPDSTVTVQLTDQEGDPVGDPIQVTVDENGNFSQDLTVPQDAAPGEYDIVVTDADDQQHSAPLSVTEASGENPDAGNGELGDRIWRDLDADGIQDAGEAGLPGIVVNLLDAEGNPVNDASGAPLTALSDENGNYWFTGLELGEYTVQFIAPDGASFSPATAGDDRAADSDPAADGITGVVALTSTAPVNSSVDAGIVEAPAPAEPIITVNPGEVEPGQSTEVTGEGFAPDSEATVQLVDPEGNPVGEPIIVPTGQDGRFTTGIAIPEDAAPGEYQLLVTDPEGNRDEASITVIEPGDGQQPPAPVGEAALGDLVFDDANANGIQDEGEAGLAGLAVHLLDASGNPVHDSTGAPITTTTDEQGNYSFTGLALGEYIVAFTAPEGSGFSPAEAGEDREADSNADANGRTAVLVLTSEKPVDLSIDAGIITEGGNGDNAENGELGDRVWNDANANGIQDPQEPGVADVKVNLLDAEGNPVAGEDGQQLSTTTDGNGNYRFAGLKIQQYIVEFEAPEGSSFAPAQQGDDRGVDSDAAGNGRTEAVALTGISPVNHGVDAGLVDAPAVQEATVSVNPGEIAPGGTGTVNGQGYAPDSKVQIQLVDADGNPVGDPITATTDEQGNFSVELLVPEDAAPGEHRVTATDEEGNEDSTVLLVTDPNSDEDGVGDSTDQGLIGDFVWDDRNKNGIQDQDEPGLQGIGVQLADAQGAPVLDVQGNELRTTTGEDGKYSFEKLNFGEYTVKFQAPEGAVFAPAAAGEDRAVDSDASKEGISPVIELSEQSPQDTSVDAGLVLDEAQVADPEFTVNPEQAGPGDEVKIEGEGYQPDSTIVIELRDQDGNVIERIEAESDGNGKIDATLSIPEDAKDGEYQVVTIDEDGNEESRTLRISDAPTETCTAEQSLSITPNEVQPGQAITVTGTGYTEGQTVAIEVTGTDGKPVQISIAQAAAEQLITIGESCGFEFKFQLPEDLADGTYTVEIRDEEGAVIDSGQFEVIAQNDGNSNAPDESKNDGEDKQKDGEDLADTGAEVIGFSLLALLAAAGGMVLTIAARRRQRS